MNTHPRDQFSLFDLPPASPGYTDGGIGFKEAGGASEDAARRIADSLCALRGDVLAEFQKDPDQGRTPDEVAASLGRSLLSVRPRCSELIKAGDLVKTPARRKNRSGLTATILKVNPMRARPSAARQSGAA